MTWGKSRNRITGPEFFSGVQMIYLLVLLVMAMVIGPVMWMKPSAGQQRLARMRMRARQLGLDIRVTELPQTHRASVRREDVLQGAVYRIPVHDPRKVLPLNYRCVRDLRGEWEFEGKALPAPLQQIVEAAQQQLPRDVVAIELGPQGPGVYWREAGDEAAVDAVAARLRLIFDAMQV